LGCLYLFFELDKKTQGLIQHLSRWSRNPQKLLFSSLSHHLLDQLVDQLLSVTPSTVALGEGVSLGLESTERRGELEWPQEVVGLLELWSAGSDLVNEVLNAGDSVLSELVGDDAVVRKWKSASVDLSVSSLVDKVLDGSSGGEAISHEWLDNLNHVPGSLVKLDEHTVVELSKSEKLKDLLGLGSELVNTKRNND